MDESKTKEEFIKRYCYLYDNIDFFYKLLTENKEQYLQEGCRILEYILLGNKSIDTIYEEDNYFKYLEKRFFIFVNSKRFERKTGINALFDKAKHITGYIIKKSTQKEYVQSKITLPEIVKGKKYHVWVERPTSKEIEAFENVVYNTELNNLYGIDIITSLDECQDNVIAVIYLLKTLYQYIENQDSPLNIDDTISKVKEDKLRCMDEYLSIPRYSYDCRYNIREALKHPIASASYPFAPAETVIFRIKGDFGEKGNEFISYVSQNLCLTEGSIKELHLRNNETKAKTKQI